MSESRQGGQSRTRSLLIIVLTLFRSTKFPQMLHFEEHFPLHMSWWSAIIFYNYKVNMQNEWKHFLLNFLCLFVCLFVCLFACLFSACILASASVILCVGVKYQTELSNSMLILHISIKSCRCFHSFSILKLTVVLRIVLVQVLKRNSVIFRTIISLFSQN